MTVLSPSPEQEEVLALGLSSIRVRAGAGTGKTTTVAMVIANLVTEHGVQPEQILGITFTNKAAAELADRVRATLTDEIDPGRQVEVHTYHGFAAQVLSEFGALAGVDNRASVITPTFSRQLMSETFNNQSFEYLDITQSRTLDRVRRLGDRLGDHLRQPSDLISVSMWHDGEVWGARREMAEALVRYETDKRRLRVVDYSDLVTLSTRVVTDFPELAEAIRQRYQAVVLDEYQDTNPAQRVLLTSIFGSGFPVIAVGDEDQTIYEWRGASAENFEEFTSHFRLPNGEPAHERGLTLNRRSTGEILAVANQVRRQANPEADRLQPVADAGTGEVVTYWANDALEEAEWIARTFEGLHEEGTRWSDMAVLFRKNKDFAVVVDAMGRHDIPVEVANVGGLFSVPEVADIRAWLTVLEHPEDSAALTQVLFGSRFRLGLADLAPLTRWVQETDDTDDTDDPAPITLIEAIEEADLIPHLRYGARQALRRFLDIYREVLAESQGLSLVETCRMILDRTRAWQDIEALPSNARLTARLNIYRLLDLAEEWSPLRGRPSVGAFLDYLETMEQEPAEELDSAHLSGEDAVTLVTVHRAKGLEWENVALPAVVKDNFPSRAQQYPDPLRFAEHLPTELRIDDSLHLPGDDKKRIAYLRNRHNRQEWRVAYVAVTRAKKRLLVTGAHWYGLPEPKKTPREPSDLFRLVSEHPSATSAGHAELGERPALLRPERLSPSPDPVFEEGWEAGLRAAISDVSAMRDRAANLGMEDEYERIVEHMSERLFSLAEPAPEDIEEAPATISVTGLVTYAQCPKRYYWTDVDPLPKRRNKAAMRGTEIHRRVELHQRGQVPFAEMTDDLYDFAGDEKGKDAEGGFQAYLNSRFAERPATLVEAPFTIELGTGYRLRGRIDAVYCDGTSWEVVDFKSGRPRDDPSRIVQLQAYAVAVSEVDFGPPPPKELVVTFAYLGGGLKEERIPADEPWVAKARDRLHNLTSSMAGGDFTETPGDWCGDCDFLQFCAPGQAEVSH